jgi:hypothetical protein
MHPNREGASPVQPQLLRLEQDSLARRPRPCRPPAYAVIRVSGEPSMSLSCHLMAPGRPEPRIVPQRFRADPGPWLVVRKSWSRQSMRRSSLETFCVGSNRICLGSNQSSVGPHQTRVVFGDPQRAVAKPRTRFFQKLNSSKKERHLLNRRCCG